ncbi:PH domain-containing protein [Streptomyces viridosporus]|uniref:PH domain-containing protein n=1 Tax=Streptomyces viridosporus T7A TaxID=665577 RepID=A0ABX6AKU8_STRVD|nr:PH domain-containing protein [Streptomyces viridosporus]QEU87433.1 PH domain-containing protein [Streptomyces viridosporus T7A]
MTTPEPPSPAPEPSKPTKTSKAPQSPASAAPQYKDRIYRSPAALAGGVLLLALIGWLGIDALVAGEGRTPWLALAVMLFLVPLVVAYTLRPAVFANDDRLRVRNPFRVVVLPWGQVASLRSGFTNEVVDDSGTKYQLWAIPVSLRARKRASRAQDRLDARAARAAGRGEGRAPGAGPGGVTEAPRRAEGDQIMDELRRTHEIRQEEPAAQGEVTVRWAYEIAGPAVAGAVLLAVLLAVG